MINGLKLRLMVNGLGLINDKDLTELLLELVLMINMCSTSPMIWAPDKQAEVFSNSVSISKRHRSQSSKKSTPRCTAHRGVKILVLAIKKKILKIFSYMIE